MFAQSALHRNAGETLAAASAEPQLDESWLAAHDPNDAGGPGFGAQSIGGTTARTSTKRRVGRGGTFESLGLSKELMSGLRRQNYKMPTPIQRNTLPLTLQGKDIMAMARTGTFIEHKRLSDAEIEPCPVLSRNFLELAAP